MALLERSVQVDSQQSYEIPAVSGSTQDSGFRSVVCQWHLPESDVLR